ncbi:caspase family protein [Methylocapsa sp. S129]|uniref:caspase family protein n=1 Tax=Methylocapsa sp. S129 TaxID=1641869 RepID=UPI00131E7A41|nr:caspase family protein [Methylocapsa sp. S129]
MRRINWLGLALLASLLIGLTVGAAIARAETRVALVIGNGAYREVATLANPPNDAVDVAAELKTLGFKVTTGVNLDQAGMERAIAEFALAAASADVSLFYYGGHGLQVASHNYLIPVDAQLHSEEDIYKHSVNFDEVLKAQEGEGIHLVFLDACRTNPLKDAPASAHAEGLARVGNAAGFLIAFATQPDNVAFDGAGRNSPFAQSLLGHLAAVGQNISSMMIEVRKDVIAATGGAQIPWENSSLTRQFYFAPGEAPSGSPDTLLWQLAGGQRDVSLLHIYLDRYPEGSHVGDVKALLAEVGKTGKGAADAPPAPAKENVEELLWKLARNGRQKPLVDLYLARYPSGAHVQEATGLLASLQQTQGSDAPPGIVCERLATHPRDSTANNSGVDLDTLAKNAEPAIAACRAAVDQNPNVSHYLALLARATAAAGRRDDAIGLYRKAAEAGDVRAMVSLGLLLESGDGVAKDIAAANALYEKAAARGSADGAINLAVALMSGKGVEKNASRAAALLRTASQGGSAIATYDLGVLAQEGAAGNPAEALDFFQQSSSLGDPRGYLASAILLDEGRGVPKDPAGAAEELLRGVAGDDGSAFNQLTAKASSWSHDTIRAVQVRLKEAGYYAGLVDGKGGATLAPALKQWRLLGPPQKG